MKNESFRIGKKISSLLFILILATNLAFGASNEICKPTLRAEGVVIENTKGELAEVIINSKKGDGVLLNLSIFYGESTQESIKTAYKLAKEMAEGSCLITVTFPHVRDYVDGPSGGALFTLKFYEAITGKKPKYNYLITGGITEEGVITPVGGVFEKTQAFLNSPYEIFLFPYIRVEEALIIYSLAEENGKEAIPVNDISVAYDLVYRNKREVDVKKVIEENVMGEAEEFSPYNASLAKESAKNYMEREKEILEENKESLPKYYYELVNISLERQEKAFEKGYYYTTANEGFNRLAFLLAFTQEREELKKEAEECLNSLNFFEERETNWEEVTGAKARYYRALEQFKEEDAKLFFEKIEEKERFARTLLWCESAKEWNKEGEGKMLNKSALKQEVDIVVNEFGIENLPERMRRALKDGEYAVFLYEYAFLKEGEEELKESYESKWASLYASQAYFLKQTNKDWKDVARLSNNLEELKEIVRFGEIEEGKNEERGVIGNINSIGREEAIKIVYLFLGFGGGVLICKLLDFLKK